MPGRTYTFADAELDKKDPTKGALVDALANFGKDRLLRLMVLEAFLSALFLVALISIRPNPALLLAYSIAIFLAYAYSLPPFRLKGRFVLAMCSLMLILSVIPITFTYMVVSPRIDTLFVS